MSLKAQVGVQEQVVEEDCCFHSCGEAASPVKKGYVIRISEQCLQCSVSCAGMFLVLVYIPIQFFTEVFFEIRTKPLFVPAPCFKFAMQRGKNLV